MEVLGMNTAERRNWEIVKALGYERGGKCWERFCERIAGTKGAPARRAAFLEAALRATALRRGEIGGYDGAPHHVRLRAWEERQALALAEKAGQHYDEHGYNRGEYRSTQHLDYVAPWDAKVVPFCDLGGEGLGLVEVSRKIVYARSCQWGPSTSATRFLVGRNEAGTYFAHPVPPTVRTVAEALDWIWGGRSKDIIQRQGDITLIAGAGPKLPTLPLGHVVDEEAGVIRHATHPDLPLPGKGQRIIVGRRAFARTSEPTRD